MNILITGGNGFLGINLCKTLLASGEVKNLIVLDNFYSSNRNNQTYIIGDIPDGVNYIFREHDIRFDIFELMEEITTEYEIDNIDQIYHLACPASPRTYQFSKIYTHETTIYGLINVLRYANATKARVLYTSTSEVYGDPEVEVQDEDYRGNVATIGPRACYDEGKRMGETICYDYHTEHGTDIRLVRIFNSYGPYMDINDGRVVSNFITQRLANEPFTVYGNGTQTRSMCHVNDTVEGIVALMNLDSSDVIVNPINIGNDNEITMLHLAELIEMCIHGSDDISDSIKYEPLPTHDPKRRRPDLTKAKTLLGWEPTTLTEDGIENTIKYFSELINKTVVDE